MALERTKELNATNLKMRADLEAYAVELKTQIDSAKTRSTTQIEAVKTAASDWTEKFKMSMFGLIEAGAGLGKSGGRDQQKSPSVGRKEVAVWKLPEHVSKHEFGDLFDTIDTNLDVAHNIKFPEMVLDKVKRSEVEVNEGNWTFIIAMVNDELPANKLIDVEIAKGKARGPEGFLGGADPWYKKEYIFEL